MIEAAMSQGSLRRSSSAAPGQHGAEAFALLDVVRVRQPVPEHDLAGGEEGTIVDILDCPVPAYLVDFSGGSADAADPSLPVVALTADQLSLVWRHRLSRSRTFRPDRVGSRLRPRRPDDPSSPCSRVLQSARQ
jgi:hypothetical protein